jgi:hypothetical protein
MQSGRENLNNQSDPAAVLAGYGSWYGTYTMNEQTKTVIHHFEGALAPGSIGQSSPPHHYDVSPDGKLLTISVPNLVTVYERLW